MQSSNVDSNNSGKIFVGFGYQPKATVGHSSQGEILMQADAIDEPGSGGKISDKYKQQIWAVSDTDNQTIVVEEETAD